MEGAVSWSQINFIAIVIISVAGFGFGLAWRLQSLRGSDREKLEDQFASREAALVGRIHALELSNAGTMVVLEHIDDFKDEMKRLVEELRAERRDDMEAINRRLDAVHNAARMFTAKNQIE